MHLLAEIDDNQLGLPLPSEALSRTSFVERKAARIILFDKEQRIALMHVSLFGYYKLPGGGIEEGESWQDAAVRESMEETGCVIALRSQEVGHIIEWRASFKTKQTSYCVLADVIKDTGHIELTREEEIDGLELKWVKFSEAIDLISQGKPKDYMGHFIQKRDLIFLKAAQDKYKI